MENSADENGRQSVDAGACSDGPTSLVGAGPPSPLTGCYLLIVVGEPHSPEHKDMILQRLIKGFLSWDAGDCHVNLEDELKTITSQGLEGEEGKHGERLIQFASENLVTEILIHPQLNTFVQCIRNLLSSFTRHRHIIHAGYTFSGNGSWILQDGTFSVADFSEAFQEHEVQRVLRAYPETITMDIHCAPLGQWSMLPDKSFAKTCRIRINPVDVLDSGSVSINEFVDYLAPMITPTYITDLLESSEIVGNIRFSHPTLYVFPGGQGDAALFGINGFNMLVDGGFSRKACFWDFVRHLDRLDAVLMTRINNCNINGIGSVAERKHNSHVYPQVGHFFCNLPERKNLPSPDDDKDKDALVLDLLEQGHQLVSNLKSLNLKAQNCYRDQDPINLYHKVGHGTLDMYVISPAKDSKEVKEFIAKWGAGDPKLFATKDSKEFSFPIQNMISICALLVWTPANPEDNITRILFPGSTPEAKIFEGLDKLKNVQFMKNPVCSVKSITPSISTTALAKKTLKTGPIEKIMPEPILPSKQQFKSSEKEKEKDKEKDNKVADNKLKTEQQDNKITESQAAEQKKEIIVDEAKVEKQISNKVESKPKSVKPKPKTDPAKKAEKVEVEKKDETKDSKPASDIESHDEVEKTTDGTEAEPAGEVEITDVVDEAATPKAADADVKTTKSKRKSKIDSKPPIRSRVDSRPPKVTAEKKTFKKDSSEPKDSSSPTTPKKVIDTAKPQAAATEVKEKITKAKTVTRTLATRSSPRGTPAKSAKDANNRKVLEARQKPVAPVKKESPPRQDKKEVVKEAKETRVERKPISRRPKGASPARKAAGSPVKAARTIKTEKDSVIRRKKLDKSGTTDSSLVSTPSADDVTAAKKVLVPDQAIAAAAAAGGAIKQDDFDLKEEQAAIQEIEAVFRKDEKSKQTELLPEHREIQDSATEPEEEEEYLIIEKEEQYTEDSINEAESSANREEEIQKHQRDSLESEKRQKEAADDEKVDEAEKDTIKKMKGQTAEVVELIEESADGDDENFDKDHLQDEVQNILTSAQEIAKSKMETSDILVKTDETCSTVPDDRLSSTKKSDTKDDIEADVEKDAVEEQQQQPQGPEVQPDEKFSGNAESTTAPTLPEDERIPLDEIKEDLVIEEKHVKEETKETEIAVQVLTTVFEPLERKIPGKMQIDLQNGHLRDIIKTPDEVADLPMHEEADYGVYDDLSGRKSTEKELDDKAEPVTSELPEKETASIPCEQEETVDATDETVQVKKETDIDVGSDKKIEQIKTETETIDIKDDAKIDDKDAQNIDVADEEKEEDAIQKEKEIEVKEEIEDTISESGKEVENEEAEIDAKEQKEVAKQETKEIDEKEQKEEIDQVEDETAELGAEKTEVEEKHEIESIKTTDVEDTVKDIETDDKENIELQEEDQKDDIIEKGLQDEPKEMIDESGSLPASKDIVKQDADETKTKDVQETSTEEIVEKSAENIVEDSYELKVAKTEEQDDSEDQYKGMQPVEEIFEKMLVEKPKAGLSAKPEVESEIMDKSAIDLETYPYDLKSYTTELRETHITTLESPVAEKSIEQKILEKVPEDKEVEDLSKSGSYIIEDIKIIQREESGLNDIKEEEEEDRFSPPEKLETTISKSASPASDKLDAAVSQVRSRTPEDVIKIVASVAEVLKSDKDLEEIIPDLDVNELERRLSEHKTDNEATVQRMLVTASSEDGGGELEICPEGTIVFTPTSTPDMIASGMISPEIRIEEHKDDEEKEESAPGSRRSSKSPASSPEQKTSPTSIDEKEKHELPEKSAKKEEAIKPTEKPIEKFDTISESRRESEFSTLSEKDITKDESSAEEHTSRPLSAASQLSDFRDDVVEELQALGKSRQDSIASEKSPARTLSIKDETSRPISAASHTSDKDADDVASESVASQKEDVIVTKSPTGSNKDEKADASRPESKLLEKGDIAVSSRPESAASAKSQKDDDKKTPEQSVSQKESPASRPLSALSQKSEGGKLEKPIEDKATTRPESAASTKSHESDTKKDESDIAKSPKSESRPESRGDTGKLPIVEDKTSPRPLSVASDKSEKETTQRPESALSQKSDSGKSQKDDNKVSPRPESATSTKSNDDSVEKAKSPGKSEDKLLPEDTQRPESALSQKSESIKSQKDDGKTSPCPESAVRPTSAMSAKSEKLEKDEPAAATGSRPESVMSQKSDAATKLTSKLEVSASEDMHAVQSREDFSRPDSPASFNEEALLVEHTDEKYDILQVTTQKVDLSRPPSVASYHGDNDDLLARPESPPSCEDDGAGKTTTMVSGATEVVETITTVTKTVIVSTTSETEVVSQEAKTDASSSKDASSKEHSRPESAASHASEDQDMVEEDDHVIFKESRSKSLAIGSTTVSEGDSRRDSRRLSALVESVSSSRDDIHMIGKSLASLKSEATSRKTSVDSVTAEQKPSVSPEKDLSEITGSDLASKISTISTVSSSVSPATMEKDSLDESSSLNTTIDKDSLSLEAAKTTTKEIGKITTEIIEEKLTQISTQTSVTDSTSDSLLGGGKTPPTVPVSPNIQTEQIMKETQQMEEHFTETTKSSSESISITPAPITTVKTIRTEEIISSSRSSTPTKQQRTATPDIDASGSDGETITRIVKTTIVTTTTTVDKDGKSIITKTEVVEEDENIDDSKDRDSLSSLDVGHRDVSAMKTSEVRSYTPGSDFRDDEVPESPFSLTSQAAHSPASGKFVYEEGYSLDRSSSGISKRSDIEVDDSQDDIPPQYGSEEIKSAISVSSTYKADPMSTSFYGALPEMSTSKTEPIPIKSYKTVTRTYVEYTSSPEGSIETHTTKERKILDDADMDFEKALGQSGKDDVMTSSTYEYTTSSEHGQGKEKTVTELETCEGASSSTVTTTTTTTSTSADKDPLKIWGKPLGLPSPAPTPPCEGDARTTPKKERKFVLAKNKLNNDKNLRKRSESPVKGKKSAPVYVDLAYVPHHGNSYYSHIEFFKRIRARYYVFSGTEPSRDVYNALLEAKQTWEDKDLEVTIIPTYDTDVLGYWVSENEDLLAQYHIDLSPSAARCTINLQDHETSCSAYRLEF